MLNILRNQLILLTLVLLAGTTLYPAEAARQAVYMISIDGDIDAGRAAFVSRALDEAGKRSDAAAVLLIIDTLGGRIDAAMRMRDAIENSGLTSIAMVNGRALSAGALLVISCDRIVMRPGSTLGAAEPRLIAPGRQPMPVDEKELSAVKAEFKAAAEAHGRSSAIAEAMVDRKTGVKGLLAPGHLLTLTSGQAHQHGYADLVEQDIAPALEKLGYKDVRIVPINPGLAERIAEIISRPAVSTLLLIVGLLGLLIELVMPGWGIFGLIGTLALAAFFGGHMVAGLAGWESVALFAVGIILLAAELFLLPGFGVTGAAGLAAIALSIVMTFNNPALGILIVTLTLIIVTAVMILAIRHLPLKGNWRRLILESSTSAEEGFTAVEMSSGYEGKIGRALTDLRPAGVAEIEGTRLDVVSEGGYILRTKRVQVIAVKGRRIIVREVEEI